MNQKPEWKIVHNLTSHYNLTSIIPEELSLLTDRIENSTEWYEKFCKTFAGETKLAQGLIKSQKGQLNYLINIRRNALFPLHH